MAEKDSILELVVFYVDPNTHCEGSNAYLGGKERRRVLLKGDEQTRYSMFVEAVMKKCGLKEEAMARGLGSEIAIKIARIEKDKNGTRCFAVNNQDSFELESPAFSESLIQGKNYIF